MKTFLSLGLSLFLWGTAHAGVIIDDFSAFPAENADLNFTAPNLGRNPTFLRHFGLDPKHVLGGIRSVSLNGYSAIPVEASFDPGKKLARITFDKLCTGTASLSYQGGNMGEGRDLNIDFTKDGAKALFVFFLAAPSAGTLVVTIYSGDKLETVGQPIKTGAPVVFPFTAFKEVDFKKVDGVTLEIRVPREVNKKLVYEIGRIDVQPLGVK